MKSNETNSRETRVHCDFNEVIWPRIKSKGKGRFTAWLRIGNLENEYGVSRSSLNMCDNHPTDNRNRKFNFMLIT